jgi:hypothetical protein
VQGVADAGSSPGSSDEVPRPRRPAMKSLAELADRHPLLVVASAAILVGAAHALWIWSHRRLGALDADEAGYLANAMRFRRELVDAGPRELLTEVARTGTAPLVPLLSAALLLVGPLDPRTGMLVQPMLMGLASVAVTALTVRLVRPRTAVLAGLAFLTFPAVILGTQSYWFGLGVTALTGLTMWALFRSERCANRWIWAFGLGLGAVAMSRTMALGFLPALVAAGVVTAGRDRTRLLRLAAATLLGVAVAAPWYLAAREAVFSYLFTYGYGQRAEGFGSASIAARLVDLPTQLVLSTGVVAGIATIAAALAAIVTNRHRLRHAILLYVARPERAALAVFTIGGAAALLSTANQGGWFDLPLLVGLVPLGAELISRLRRGVRRAITALLGLQGVVLLASAWWLLPYAAIVPLPTHYEAAFAEYDQRFDSTRRSELPRVAAEWERVNRRVAAELRRLDTEEDSVFTTSGNMVLLNTNTLMISAELQGWGADLRVPETQADPAVRAAELTSTAWGMDGGTARRVLVLIDHERTLFTPDGDVAGFSRQAEASGWTTRAEFELPIEGRVRVLLPR